MSLETVVSRVRVLGRAGLVTRSTVRRKNDNGRLTPVFFAMSDAFEHYAAKVRGVAWLMPELSFADSQILDAGRKFVSDWRKAAAVNRARRKAACQRVVLRLVRSLQNITRD